MKKILIFDMDGVLLAPRGYHLALQETVRLGAEGLGYPDITLSDEQIAQFEGLGISSEWHSSAAALSMVAFDGELSLGRLFEALKRQPAQIPARIRLERCIEEITGDAQRIHESETLQSASYKTFQELILGSADFERIYGISSRLDVESYLLQFDKPLLVTSTRERLLAWIEHSEHGCVVMTNRPSREMPDAEYGLRLVGLDGMRLIGYGDIEWLAQQVGDSASKLQKPNAVHALAAMLVAVGKDLDESLLSAHALLKGVDVNGFDGGELVVFEDTPAGLISVDAAGAFFGAPVRKVGIAPSAVKADFLRAQGAQVFDDINAALGEVL